MNGRTASRATLPPHFMTRIVKSTYVPVHRMYWHQATKTVYNNRTNAKQTRRSVRGNDFLVNTRQKNGTRNGRRSIGQKVICHEGNEQNSIRNWMFSCPTTYQRDSLFKKC